MLCCGEENKVCQSRGFSGGRGIGGRERERQEGGEKKVTGMMKSYQCLLAVLLVLGSHGVHTQRDMLAFLPDLHESVPQLEFLLLCLTDAFLERE